MSGEMDSKSDAEKNSEQLNLKVIGQDGQTVQFKIKRSTPFRKLINAYCDRSRLTSSTLRFMFDGNRIDEMDTPKSMDMEEGDTIEVFTQQSGGIKEHAVHSINANYDDVTCSKNIKCGGYSNISLITYKQPVPADLPKSRFRRRKFVNGL